MLDQNYEHLSTIFTVLLINSWHQDAGIEGSHPNSNCSDAGKCFESLSNYSKDPSDFKYFNFSWIRTFITDKNLIQYALDLRKPDLRKNFDLRKIVATTDFFVHKLFDLRKIF